MIIRTLETTPRGATHWSTREMAKAVGLSHTAISRIWHTFGLQPHRTETFKLSNDPLLVEKVRDIVGLYLDPPAHAAVFCVDEKPQIQALDRTQPLLPMQPGQVERRTHDYKRHGTTTLFAALNAKTSEVITQFHQRHRSAQFREFLDLIEAQVPRRLDVHIIMDNYSPHKTALIRNWFAQAPAIPCALHAHLRFVAESGRAVVRRADHETDPSRRLPQRRAAESRHPGIHRCPSRDPKPFVWTKSADEILASIARFAQRTADARAAQQIHEPWLRDTSVPPVDSAAADSSLIAVVRSNSGTTDGLCRPRHVVGSESTPSIKCSGIRQTQVSGPNSTCRACPLEHESSRRVIGRCTFVHRRHPGVPPTFRVTFDICVLTVLWPIDWSFNTRNGYACARSTDRRPNGGVGKPSAMRKGSNRFPRGSAEMGGSAIDDESSSGQSFVVPKCRRACWFEPHGNSHAPNRSCPTDPARWRFDRADELGPGRGSECRRRTVN